MKKVKWLLCFILTVSLLSGCRRHADAPAIMSSNIVSVEDQQWLEALLKKHHLSHVSTYMDWVKDYNKEGLKGTGMVTQWQDARSIIYNEAKLLERYEKTHQESDANCRMSAFTLLDKHISTNDSIAEAGSYLMFDIDGIENNRQFQFLKKREADFITLFNEIDVTNIGKDAYMSQYPDRYQRAEIVMDLKDVSLITVVMHDPDFNLLFVGHAGLLIHDGDDYIFVEKIAFEQPFQVSKLSSPKELKNLFKMRNQYFSEGHAKGPYVYENDHLLFRY